jgi:hypothetical protein
MRMIPSADAIGQTECERETLSDAVQTEGQREAQAAGHLNLEGSSLHDGAEAGAGAVGRKPTL